MDTTLKYIKMCEKVGEIQKEWIPQVGDYIWRKYTVFGDVIDRTIWPEDKMYEVIILTYASSADGYFHAVKSGTNDGENRIFETHNELHKATCIFIPRQDQLQEMLYPKGNQRVTSLVCSSYDFITSELWEPEMFDSMEKFWLAFVMKEKYGKVWDDKKEEWIL